MRCHVVCFVLFIRGDLPCSDHTKISCFDLPSTQVIPLLSKYLWSRIFFSHFGCLKRVAILRYSLSLVGSKYWLVELEFSPLLCKKGCIKVLSLLNIQTLSTLYLIPCYDRNSCRNPSSSSFLLQRKLIVCFINILTNIIRYFKPIHGTLENTWKIWSNQNKFKYFEPSILLTSILFLLDTIKVGSGRSIYRCLNMINKCKSVTWSYMKNVH